MFPCTGCGLCCQYISRVEELKEFDSGNGVCKFYNKVSKKCEIYETRPSICRIDRMFELKYKKLFTRKEFYIKNARVCNRLQLDYNLNNHFNVTIGD